MFEIVFDYKLILKALKTLIRLFQVVAVVCMLTGCESCEQDYPAGESDMLGTVNISVNSQFATSFIKYVPSEGSKADINCSECRLEQIGSGTDAEFGAFDVYLTCSWNPVDGSHSCTEGYITDYKGNTLTLVCNDGDNGVVFTPEFPYDQTFLCAEFDFTGGTGRFEGASGTGVMKCDIKGASNSIIHHWEAELTLLQQ